MTTTRVHLLRHAEVDNPRGVLYGRLPGYRLSDLGHAMARRVAETLAGRDITYLVTSPLERAQETARPIAEKLGLDVVTDDRVIEANNVFEGLTIGVGEGSLRSPRHWWHLRNPYRPSWGEPYAEVAARMRAALGAAAAAARGHEALIVSHQLPIWVLRLSLEGRRLWHHPGRRECALASLTTVTCEDGEIVAIGYHEPAADLVAGATDYGGGA
ncbi:MAG: histidine phosphatase family protein [Actinomycetota bacterium]